MASGVDGYAVSGGTHTSAVTVEIDEATLKALEALPDSRPNRKAEFTPMQDAMLLRYWARKRKADVARAVGYSENVCRERYHELTAKKEALS